MTRFLTSCLLLLSLTLNAQKLFKPYTLPDEQLPAWVSEMYSDHPNVWRVDDGYRAWRRDYPEAKTSHTQFYKKWRHAVEPYVNPQGWVEKRDDAARAAFRQRLADLKSAGPVAARGSTWSCIGPFETFNTNTGATPFAKSEQANIYCIDQSFSNPDVVYCGTEGAEIFKTTDHGLHWFCVSRQLDITSVTALEVHPTNPDIVFAGEGSNIRRSTDGGQTWQIVLTVQDCSPNEILVNPANTQIVLAATWKGLYRSEDGGSTWNQVFPEACYDIEWKTDDPQTAFLVRNDPQAVICRFYKSSDAGLTWTLKDNGWYASSDSGRSDGGARIAVTKADPNRIYAVLIGNAKAGDSDFIGIWRSDDGGESWTLPNPPAGGPYNDTTHINLATIGNTGGYDQGFYNLGLDASDSNPDQLLAGFLKLWVSYDGAKSYNCIGGYCSNAFNYVHPDCQEIEINDNDVWMTSDGGIEHSTDFFQTHYASNRGITGSDFWGFGTGWNEDVLVGGRYHNGNTGWYENWNEGECLGLGGGEASTGYVNPGAGRKTYFSDIGGVILPEEQNGFADYFSIGVYPNESYYDAESGEIEWDPRCWNTFFVTHDNKLWKTVDGGSNWAVLYKFGADSTSRALQFEISRSNPDVMYLFQRASYSWDPGKLWKTTDGGQSWNELPLPPGYARRMVMTMSPENENLIWVAYADGADGQKIYKSTDGGQTWINLSTNALNGEHISYILHQAGTNGGVYIGTYRTIWYKNDDMAEWMPYNDGLPVSVATCILRPFYRDGKLRIGAYGKGIWEAPFYEPSHPIAQPMVGKRETSCPGDTLQFDDFSMLNHAGATWQWQFPGGTPTASSLRNPKVVYQNPGVYDVTLTVSNPSGTSTKTITQMVRILNPIVNNIPVVNNFSGGLGNLTILNPDGGITWEPVNITTCNPNGDTAYYVNNYTYSGYGQDEILLPVNLDLTQILHPILSFRVAYAPYYDGNYFIDSLKVLVSDDCGSNFQTIFRSGGEALSTTTSGIGLNNLYEYDAFSPQSCDEWRQISLDLSAFSGKYITVKFRNQSGYGNNMYLDDINLSGLPVSGTHAPTQTMRLVVQPNPTGGTTRLSGNLQDGGSASLTVENTAGQVLIQQVLQLPEGPWEHSLELDRLPAGVYWVKLQTGTGKMGIQKIVKR
jgi:photosystem II stability/assembly factor-like uncharacterized protein/PKD repeat protein